MSTATATNAVGCSPLFLVHGLSPPVYTDHDPLAKNDGGEQISNTTRTCNSYKTGDEKAVFSQAVELG